MKRAPGILVGAALGLLAGGFWPRAAAAQCTTVIATTPTGSTFPCTVCVEGGKPVSVICTPPILGR
jgi:hypothetical protein